MRGVKILSLAFVVYLFTLCVFYVKNSGFLTFEKPLEVTRERAQLVVSLGNYEQSSLNSDASKCYNNSEEKKYPFDKHSANKTDSNKMPKIRNFADITMSQCKHWKYPANLPDASVIIVFDNIDLKTLVSAIEHVINRTPPQILREIVIFDNNCSVENDRFRGDLQRSIAVYGDKVIINRNLKRTNLAIARRHAAEVAKGKVVVFIDPFCEVNVNWLPPLLSPIKKIETTLTVPITDDIDESRFKNHSAFLNPYHRGIFDWSMHYKESELPKCQKSARKYKSEPYESPTFSKRVFAINRTFFLKLGGQDPGITWREAQNIELSFKVWLCGGRILWVPCSRVHILQSDAITDQPIPRLISAKRIVKVWLGERFNKYFFTREPMAKYVNEGNISKQFLLKKKLNCKTFQWYLAHVAYDVFKKYPPLPPNIEWGVLIHLRLVACVNALSGGSLQLLPCSKASLIFRLNARGQLAVEDSCVTGNEKEIKVVDCNPGTVNGPWQYDPDDMMVYETRQQKCLQATKRFSSIPIVYCDEHDMDQKWRFLPIKNISFLIKHTRRRKIR